MLLVYHEYDVLMGGSKPVRSKIFVRIHLSLVLQITCRTFE